MTAGRRSGPVVVALGCLAGSSLVLLAAGRTWASVTVRLPAPLPPRLLPLSGRQLAPGAAALGLVGLAGVVALVATRGRGRVATGVLLAVAGAGAAAAALLARMDLDRRVLRPAGRAVGLDEAYPSAVDATAWPWVAVVGGVLVALAGLVTALRGRCWAGLSSRYEAPVTAGGSPDLDGTDPAPALPEQAEAGSGPDDRASADLWQALDRGEDPTASR